MQITCDGGCFFGMAAQQDDSNKKMRTTLLACGISGLLIAGSCIFMTGATVGSMKENAVTAMAGMAATQAEDTVNKSDSSKSGSDSVNGNSANSTNSTNSSSSSSAAVSGSSVSVSGGSGEATSSASAAPATSDVINQLPEGSEVVGKGKVGSEDVYIIKWGDTLSYISAETGRSVDEIAALNGISNVDVIYADSAIRIPTGH